MGDTISIDWDGDGLKIGGTFAFEFTTDVGPVAFLEGFWTIPEQGTVPIDPNDGVVTPVAAVPEPGILALLAIGAGVFGFNRSRKNA